MGLTVADVVEDPKQRFIRLHPWYPSYNGAQQRCTNPKSVGWPAYGKRGIKMLMTQDDFKKLWFRDKAYKMKQPTIDRIDNDGHYIIGNCRFIEMVDNRKRRIFKRQYSECTRCSRPGTPMARGFCYVCYEGWRKKNKRLTRDGIQGKERKKALDHWIHHRQIKITGYKAPISNKSKILSVKGKHEA